MKFLQMNEDKSYKLVEANGTLKTMQKIVGGLVERIYYLSDLEERNIDMWCNEEGKLIGMPGNYGVFDKRNGELIDLVVGPVCFTKTNEEGETLGLSDSDISYILANYRTNMICIQADNRLFYFERFMVSMVFMRPVYHISKIFLSLFSKYP